MLQHVLNFCQQHQTNQPIYEPLNGKTFDDVWDNFFECPIGHLPVAALKIPAQEILNEMISLRSNFVPHPPDDYHQGRNSFVIYGANKNYLPYNGVHNVDESKLDVSGNSWVAQDVAPFTTNYFKDVFPSEVYDHVIVMLLEPGGWIDPHTDMVIRAKLTNIPLNLPEQSQAANTQGTIPYVVGESMIIDTSVEHAICNPSNQDRYVISVGCKYKDNARREIVKTYLSKRKRSLQASR